MNQVSLETWRKRIADQKASGLKVTAWCEKNNLSKHAYYYWRKRTGTDEEGEPEKNEAAVFAELKPAFQPIFETTAQLQISWRDLQISISNSETARLAAEFIRRLQELC